MHESTRILRARNFPVAHFRPLDCAICVVPRKPFGNVSSIHSRLFNYGCRHQTIVTVGRLVGWLAGMCRWAIAPSRLLSPAVLQLALPIALSTQLTHSCPIDSELPSRLVCRPRGLCNASALLVNHSLYPSRDKRYEATQPATGWVPVDETLLDGGWSMLIVQQCKQGHPVAIWQAP